MVAVVVFVTKIELLSLDIDHLDFVGGTEADVGAFAGVNVTNNRLNEGAQISRRAMVDLQNNRGVAVILYRHSPAKIVSCWHNRDG